MPEGQFSTLSENIRGNVITPAAGDYELARKVYNGMIDRHPDAIVRCADVADVRAVVNFARQERLTVAIRGGGHNGVGLGVCDHGLVVDLSLMKGVRVDPPAISRKDRNSVLTPGRYNERIHRHQMNRPFLTPAEQSVLSLTQCLNTQKERYLVSEFLKNPVSWLETEILYHSYTTRGEAQEVANGIDRMISEGARVGRSKLFPRPKHSSALSDTAFWS